MTEWKMTVPRDLVAALRVAGEVYGQTGKLPKLLRLHKTDITTDLRGLPATHLMTWRIGGDPAETGPYARNRRHIIIYLGG